MSNRLFSVVLKWLITFPGFARLRTKEAETFD
jgi:hypothetical protein